MEKFSGSACAFLSKSSHHCWLEVSYWFVGSEKFSQTRLASKICSRQYRRLLPDLSIPFSNDNAETWYDGMWLSVPSDIHLATQPSTCYYALCISTKIINYFFLRYKFVWYSIFRTNIFLLLKIIKLPIKEKSFSSIKWFSRETP